MRKVTIFEVLKKSMVEENIKRAECEKPEWQGYI